MLQEQLIDVRHSFLFHLCHPGIETRWKEREREREREREEPSHHFTSLYVTMSIVAMVTSKLVYLYILLVHLSWYI